MSDWMHQVREREVMLPEDIREVFRNFRNSMAGEYHKNQVWNEVSQDLWSTLDPKSPKRKAINRIYQILQSRKRKANRLAWQSDEQWQEYLEILLHDLIDILEDAWNPGE